MNQDSVEEIIANDLMHFENQRYPLKLGEQITVAEAFAAGWRARDNRANVDQIEVRESFGA